jgi:hypothetical protein
VQPTLACLPQEMVTISDIKTGWLIIPKVLLKNVIILKGSDLHTPISAFSAY